MSSSHHTTLFLQILSEVPFGALLLALSTFVIIHSLSQRRRHGLAVWPVLGMLPSLLVGVRGNAYEWVTGVLVRTNGTFTFQGPWLSNLQCVVTANPDNLKYILKTKFANFPKGEYIQGIVRDMLGHGIFSTDGEAWRRHRKRSSLQFHSAELRAAMAKSVIQLTHSRLLPVLESLVDIPFDLQDVLLRLTFDNVCMIALGTDPGCLSLGLPEMPFADAFENMTEAIALRFITPTALWKAMNYLGVGGEGKLKRSLKRADEFAYEVIRRRKAELSSLPGEKSGSDLLAVFLRLKDENGNAFPDKFLRDLCMNFVLAGRDTSSVALAWFFWLLDQNPEVEEEILAEVRRIVEERGYDGNGEGENSLVFRPEEVKRMEYLQAALSEALRLHPSVPVDFKEVTEDEVFPDGTALKKGIKVMYSLYSMGRMESIWGKDCREFRPERWLKEGRFVSEPWCKFPAFNGGPRVCLGKDFAYYQMKFVVASIICRYHVKVVQNHPVVPKLALTAYMKHGLKVILEKR
ncbi:cytochrome P450 86B1-like [Phoenix dactylifera]|uniref:Cytochrome P450 86B1-like n=1 Tax=Phoenix dactylifera TaxID=42345 RepID=A0A8B7CNC1_PHODC|nr:cytochrome P450 86B1-like [Phoenix dactylifera]